MAEEDLKRLRAARGQLKSAITRMLSYKATAESASAGDVDPILINQKRERLDKVFEEYKELNLEIALLDPSDAERIEDVEEKYDILASFYTRKIKEALGASAPESPPRLLGSPAACSTTFRLPPITLKVFSGESNVLLPWRRWESGRPLGVALV